MTDPHDPALNSGAQRKRKRQSLRIVLGIVLLLAALLTVSVVSLGIMLNRKGGIDAGLLGGWVETAVADRIGGGANVAIGSFTVERGEDGLAVLNVFDLKVKDAAGKPLISAPEAQIGLDSTLPYPGAPIRRIDMVGIEIALRIEDDGSVVIAASGPSPASPTTTTAVTPNGSDVTATALAQRLGAWLDSIEQSGIDGAHLASIGVRNGTLTLNDRRYGLTVAISGIHLGVEAPKDGGVVIKVAGAHEQQVWQATLTASAKANGRRVIDAAVSNLVTKDSLPVLLGLDHHVIDLTLNGEGQLILGDNGLLLGLSGRLFTRDGKVALPTDTQPTGVDHAFINFAMAAGSPTIQIKRAELVAGENSIAFLGEILALGDGRMRFDLTQASLIGRWLNPAAPPFAINSIQGAGIIDFSAQSVQIERLTVASGMGEQMSMEGRLFIGAGGPGFDIGLAASPMPLALALKYWPSHVQPEVRDWVKTNTREAFIQGFVLSARIPPGGLAPGVPLILPQKDLSLEATISNASFVPVPGLPPIREAQGRVAVDGTSTRIFVDKAVMEAEQGRMVALSNGSLIVADHNIKGAPTVISFQFQGPVGAVVDVVSREPLREVGGFSALKPGASGTIAAQATLKLPLKAELGINDVDYKVEGQVANFAQNDVFGDLKVEGGAFRLSVGRDETAINGEARIGGAPAKFDITQPRKGATSIRLNATLSEAARQSMGLDFGSSIRGPTPVKIQSAGQRHEIEIDLTPATMADLVPGWSKPAGQTAKARFFAQELPAGGWKIDDLALSGKGVLVRGSLQIDKDGDVISGTFPAFALSDGDRAQVKIERSGQTLNVTMRGDVFDGRTILKGFTEGSKGSARGKPKDSQDVVIDAKIDAVAGHRGEIMRKLDLKAVRRNNDIQSLRASARIGRDEPLTAELVGSGTKRQLRLETDDAGAWLRFVDVYPSMVSGQMAVAMTPPTADGTISNGAVEIVSFRIRGDQAIGGLVASADKAQPDRARTLDDKAKELRDRARQGATTETAFSRLYAGFERRGGRVIIRNGVLNGGSIGATVEGELDFPRNRLQLAGTYVPAYAINNFLARIPVVGIILGGSPDEGIFGVNFEISGALSAPQLQINPVSAVTPGILRRIVDYRNRGPLRSSGNEQPRGNGQSD